MSRPRINLVVYVAFVAVMAWLSLHVSARTSVVLTVLLTATLLSVVWSGWDFFRAQRRMREKRWVEAAQGFARYRTALELSAARRAIAWVFSSLYTRDGVALAENGLGTIALENGHFAEARQHLEAAIARDPRYAVPHINLALVLASEGRESEARDEAALGHRLGFGRKRAVKAALADALLKSRVGLTRPDGR